MEGANKGCEDQVRDEIAQQVVRAALDLLREEVIPALKVPSGLLAEHRFGPVLIEAFALPSPDGDDDRALADAQTLTEKMYAALPNVPRGLVGCFSLALGMAQIAQDGSLWGDDSKGRLSISLLALQNASEVAGMIIGEAEVEKRLEAGVRSAARTAALRAAAVRHAENRDLKAEVLRWYAASRGNFKSKDEAAIAAQKVAPVAFSTARGWLKGA